MSYIQAATYSLNGNSCCSKLNRTPLFRETWGQEVDIYDRCIYQSQASVVRRRGSSCEKAIKEIDAGRPSRLIP